MGTLPTRAVLLLGGEHDSGEIAARSTKMYFPASLATTYTPTRHRITSDPWNPPPASQPQGPPAGRPDVPPSARAGCLAKVNKNSRLRSTPDPCRDPPT